MPCPAPDPSIAAAEQALAHQRLGEPLPAAAEHAALAGLDAAARALDPDSPQGARVLGLRAALLEELLADRWAELARLDAAIARLLAERARCEGLVVALAAALARLRALDPADPAEDR